MLYILKNTLTIKTMFYLVKVRVDLCKMAEFGKRIANKEFDNSSIKWTYCLKDDPAVGYALWETADEAEFEKKFGPYRPYYQEMSVSPVVTPMEAQALIIKKLSKQ
jgi:hypothetical protein